MIQWTEVLSTDNDSLQSLAAKLQIHPLALEDCQHRDQRPKLDNYESHQLLVWFLLAKDTVYELQFLIYPDQLVAIPHDPPPEEKSWGEYLRIHGVYKDVWHMLYAALDRASDITWQELRVLFDSVDEFEQELFDREFNPKALLLLKKQLNKVDYSVGHLSSVAKQVQNLCRPADDLNWKLRDLHDHCERISRSIALYRAQIANTIDLYWGLQANRTNKQVKRLSLLASISVPLTFWSSFWGMNFEAIPFNKHELFYAALGLMAVSVALTTWLLVRKGYWSD